MNKTLSLLASVFVLLSGSAATAQLPAFPGAEGAGSLTAGGRGTAAVPTTVYEVTTLYDSVMPGSLRYALAQNTTSRTIVFRVSGTIHLKSELKLTKANTTIAGQTAPGAGICIADHPFTIAANNVIVRHIRFRLGDRNQLLTSPAGCGLPVAPFSAACMPLNGSGDGDGLTGTGVKNVIIDHCSMSWSADEACTFYRGDSITLQWNIISEPLNYSYHFETGDADFEQHAYGGIWGGRNASFHHNLLAHCKGRTPRFDGSRNLSPYTAGQENADFRNNVIYDWGSYSVNGGEGGNYNIVGNYYKYGPATGTNNSTGVPVRAMIINPGKQTSAPVLPYGKYFLDGNFVDGNAAVTANNWKGAAMSGGAQTDTVQSKVAAAFAAMSVTTWPAEQAKDSVLAGAGAILPMRDSVDMRIVEEFNSRTGGLIDVQGGFAHGTPYAQTAGAWPVLVSTAAPADSDHDGMPDAWETANGSDPNNAADRQTIAFNSYTNLENYLNNITGGTAPPPPGPNSIAAGAKAGELKLFPNPAGSCLQIAFPAAQYGSVIAVHSAGGLLAGTWLVPEGSTAYSLNIAALPAGAYYLQFSGGNVQWTSNFIKQ